MVIELVLGVVCFAVGFKMKEIIDLVLERKASKLEEKVIASTKEVNLRIAAAIEEIHSRLDRSEISVVGVEEYPLDGEK